MSKKRIGTAPRIRPKETDWRLGRAAFDAHRDTCGHVLPDGVVERLWARADGPFAAFWVAVAKEDLRQRRIAGASKT